MRAKRGSHRRKSSPQVEWLEPRLTPSTLIQVDAAAANHPIDSNIYGVNAADSATLSALNATFNRAGGNLYSTYNYQVDAFNHGNDFFFESIPESATPGGVDDKFIAATQGGGAIPTITIPTMGWVAKLGPGGAKTASFSVAKYGPQQATDQFFPDAGNGVQVGGNPSTGPFIAGNDPNDANMPSTTAFEMGEVQRLVNKWGLAANRGVQYYTLDNEPGIWYSTHRDTSPVGVTMDQMVSRITQYGDMIKGVDPGALTMGPEEWGYLGYLYSGADKQYGDIHGYNNLPDRTAHNNMDYIPYLLQQVAANDAAWGVRSLDVLTVHFYPQSGQDDTDVTAATQLLRNRSTRSLWDPNYVDESYIGQLSDNKVDLVPRLLNWVNTYYPGTKIGITEYDWGAENHMNGATTEADILGIFGREGLDIGTRFAEASSGGPQDGSGAPTLGSAVSNAFLMYRNYDGAKDTFGNISTSAVVPNPDLLSAFSAIRSADGTLTIMVDNKDLYDPANPTTSIDLQIANFANLGDAQVWQLHAPNPNDMTTTQIDHLPDITFNGSDLLATVPKQSVTIFIIKPKANNANAPVIALIQPNSLPAAGGTSVTITGSNFTGATAVSFGNTPALTFTVNSATQITATAPAHSAGTFDVTVTTPAGTSGLVAADQVTFVNPANPGVFNFAAAEFTVREGSGSLTITVARSNGTDGTVTVNYATQDGSARAGNRYTATSGMLMFNQGDVSKTFAIPILDDSMLEGTEQANLILSNPTNGAGLGSQSTTVLTITENHGTAAQEFLADMYLDLLGRQIDQSGLSAWTAVLDKGVSRTQVVAELETSTEYRDGIVQQLYQKYLLRGADDSGLNMFAGALEAGATDEQVAATLIGSGEYFSNRGGGTNDGFLTALYQDALGRAIDPSGKSAFEQALGQGASRTQVAAQILASGEYFQVVVNGYYQRFLNRPADPSGLANFMSLLQAGGHDEDVVAALTGSGEFFVYNNPLVAHLYRDLLQRPVDPSGLQSWTQLLDSGTTDGQLARQLQATNEYQTLVVNQAYTKYLHRAVDNSGLGSHVAQLAAGATQEQVFTDLAGSQEYFDQRGSGTNDGFLSALYQDVLGRAIDPSGKAAFEQALAQGTSRAQVAAQLFASAEYQQDLVNGYYSTYLHRTADPAGVTFFAGQLANGTREEDVLAQILGSQEYFSLP